MLLTHSPAAHEDTEGGEDPREILRLHDGELSWGGVVLASWPGWCQKREGVVPEERRGGAHSAMRAHTTNRKLGAKPEGHDLVGVHRTPDIEDGDDQGKPNNLAEQDDWEGVVGGKEIVRRRNRGISSSSSSSAHEPSDRGSRRQSAGPPS